MLAESGQATKGHEKRSRAGGISVSIDPLVQVLLYQWHCEDVINETPVCARRMHRIGQQQTKLGQPSHTELPFRSNYSPFVRSPCFYSALNVEHCNYVDYTSVYCTSMSDVIGCA